MAEIIRSVNLDANETVFFGRELEHVKAKTYDIRYSELKARAMIPVSNEAGPGAEVITYQQYDSVGMAKVIASYAGDLPRVDVKGKEYSARVRSLGASYGYSIQDIRAARMAGKPLEARKASAARRAVEQSINSIAFKGDAAFGLQGLLDNPNIPDDTAPNGAGGQSVWSKKTADEILADLNGLVSGVIEDTKGVERPNTVALPIAQYNLIASMRVGDTGQTVLKFFKETHPGIEVVWLEELKGAGTANSDVALAYDRNPDKLTLEIPQEFEQFPAQEKGLEFEINCHARIGGVIVYYPLSLRKLEGI